MQKQLFFITTLWFCSLLAYSQTCIGGKWDNTSNIWYRDCTPGDQYDGRYRDGSLGHSYSPNTASGDTTITLADASHQTIYWKLYWFDNLPDNTLPVPDSIPLVAGVHCWTEPTPPLDDLLSSGNTYLQNDPAAVRVISLTFSINGSGNNSGTWWWGKNVGGVPTPWAEEAVVRIIRQRMTDACQLLADAGNTALSGKSVDANRVYIRGHSMGGTGAYRIGIKFPDIFAAIFCHAGFADFKGPCGAFTDGFNTMVGTTGQQCTGIDGNQYVARDYTDMSWFIGTHKGVSWETALGQGKKYEPPYVCMRHGTADNAVDIASADRVRAVLEAGKWGYTYQRDGGEHSDANGTRAHWMFNFRKNQSYLALTNNSTNTTVSYNYLDRIGWQPSSIVDETDHYEVQMTGTSGTADVTLHRLQNFIVTPGKEYHFWTGTKTGEGTAVSADDNGVLTLTGISAGSKLIIEPDVLSGIATADLNLEEDIILTAMPNPFNPVVTISSRNSAAGNSPRFASEAGKHLEIQIYNTQGQRVFMLSTLSLSLAAGIAWDASGMPSGVYLVVARSGSSIISKAITLMK